MVKQCTIVSSGYRVVLAPAKMTRDDTWVLIAHRAEQTYVIPRSMVPSASMLTGAIKVTTNGSKVTALTII